MKKMFCGIVVLISVAGCRVEEPGPEVAPPSQRSESVSSTVIDRQASMPEPLTVVTAVPEAVVTNAENLQNAMEGTTQSVMMVEEASTGDGQQRHSETNTTLVFDLSTVPLDPAMLEARGIKLYELNDIRILEFSTNSTPLSFSVAGLPTGACERTIIAVVRNPDMKQAKFVEFGRAAPQQHFLLCVAYIAEAYMLSGYQADLCYTVRNPDKWYVLAARYDGQEMSLYVNGECAQSIAVGLNTYPSTQVSIGSGFGGAIAGVKIWNRALASHEIRAVSENLLQDLN